MNSPDFSALDTAGLNLQAVFELTALPPALRQRLTAQTDPAPRYRQLILIGNAGPALWRAVSAAGLRGPDPIDDFSVHHVLRWFAEHCPGAALHRLYPGSAPVDLQALGRLAGWHHDSPLRIGIQPGWGTWFAYRVALLADTALPPSVPLNAPSPCDACPDTPCIDACPAAAMADGRFALERCLAYRQQPASRCEHTCVARLRCPVGASQRYPDAHIHHVYRHSLAMIVRHRQPPSADD